MALRSALPSEVRCEKATNDAIAYSCKKIGHVYSAYFLHISSSFLFVFSVTNFNPWAKQKVGAGLPPVQAALGVQPNAMLALSQKERQKKNTTLQVTKPAMLHSDFYTVLSPVTITSTINFVAMVKPDMKASVSRQSVISD